MGAFKGWQSSRKNQLFAKFPNIMFGASSSEAYGINNCNLWLTPYYGLNTSSHYAPITSWQSLIGNRMFIQTAAGNQPRLYVAHPNYNNLNVIEFQDTNRFLRYLPQIIGLVSIAIVANYNSINGRNMAFGSIVSGEAFGVGMGGSSLAAIAGPFVRSPTQGDISGTSENTSTKIVVFTPSLIMVNGIIEYVGNTGLGQYSFDGIGQTTNQGNALNGNIAEIIAFSTNLVSANCSRLSNALNDKYHIY